MSEPNTPVEFGADNSARALKMLISNLPGIAYRCRNDEDWTMEFVSEGCLALTGYPARHLVENARVSYGDLVHPDDQEWLWEKCQASLARREPCRNEYRIISATGEEKWVWEHARGIYDREGELIAIEGFIQDVTQRHRSERALRLAVEELNHRVKNNLTAVLALTKQTLDSSPSLDDFADRFLGRIHAMARNYATLSARHWKDVPLDAIVRQALSAHPSPAWRVDGDPTLLSPSIAAPMALAVHELVTNALKHGALREPGGRIHILWRADAEGMLRFDWTETLDRPSPKTLEPGVGLQLIEGFVESQLRGSVNMELGEEGLRCRFVVPILKPDSEPRPLAEIAATS